jgi:putative NADH-flavin reductase
MARRDMGTKRVLVLGASGGTGRQVVSQALEQGYEVTAFVRRPGRMRTAHERLRIVAGDVTQATTALSSAVQGQDAVISALGVGLSLNSGDLIARSMPLVVHAMETQTVRRLIFTSAYGVGSTWIDVPILGRIMLRLLLRNLYADKEAGEEILRRSRLDWTLVYPVTLTNGPRTGRYRAGERLNLRGLPRVSRADVASFLLAQIEDPTYVRKGVLISS